MKKTHSIGLLITIILILLFALQNATLVEIKFLIWSFSAQVSLLVVILIGLGFILGLLFSSFSKYKEKSKNEDNDETEDPYQ